MTEPLVDPALLGRLERLQLSTRRPLAGRFVGEHRSPRRGSSLDFADYRQYVPGDDFRRIDYQLLGRLDVLLVKLFEAEDDLTVRLVVDTSSSMAYGGKLLAAARLAAALGFVALVRRDVVTVATLDRTAPPRRFNGRGAATPLFAHLGALEPGGDSDLVGAAGGVLGRQGPGGVTVLFSDLLTPTWEDGLSRLGARGAEVVVVHVTSADDLEPQLTGDVDLVDAESGERIPVSLSPDALDRYHRSVGVWLERVAAAARRGGASYVRVDAADDPEAALLGVWRREGILR